MTFKSIGSPLITFSKKLEFKYYKLGDYWKLFMENQSIHTMRSKYLRTLNQYRDEKKYITYLDETYLTLGQKANGKDCNRLKLNLDSMSKETVQRLIIVHGGGINGFINNALLVFQSNTNGKTHHKAMNYDIFSQWMVEKYLPNLPKNSVIVFDNASYHNAQVKRTPRSNSNKLQSDEVQNNSEEKPGPNVLQKTDVDKKYKIDEIIENAGHAVLRLPPYHTELNPIENIWTLTRNSILKQYSKNKCIDAVELVIEEFSKITCEDWQKSICRVQIIENFYQNLDINLNNYIQNSLFD